MKKKKASGDHSTFFATASMGVHLHKKRRKWPLIAFFSFFLNVRRGNRYLISVLWLLVKLGSLGHLDSRPPAAISLPLQYLLNELSLNVFGPFSSWELKF